MSTTQPLRGECGLTLDRFGKTQLAAMGVMLGATAPDTKQADLASALSTIMLSAGSPLVRDSTAGRTITYSPRHDGLALMLARYLRSIWSTRVVYIPASPLSRAMLGVPEATLLKVQSRLEALKRYVSERVVPSDCFNTSMLTDLATPSRGNMPKETPRSRGTKKNCPCTACRSS